MTIHDYIKKRELTKWRTWPVVSGGPNLASNPRFFTHPDSGETEREDKFEIWANADHTHFVSLNTAKELFRIVHYDMIIFYSKWQPMQAGLDYRELEKL